MAQTPARRYNSEGLKPYPFLMRERALCASEPWQSPPFTPGTLARAQPLWAYNFGTAPAKFLMREHYIATCDVSVRNTIFDPEP